MRTVEEEKDIYGTMPCPCATRRSQRWESRKPAPSVAGMQFKIRP
jgi:hypothetical protein